MPSRMFLQELYSLSTWIVNLDNLAHILHHTFLLGILNLTVFLSQKKFPGLHSSPTCTNRTQSTSSTSRPSPSQTSRSMPSRMFLQELYSLSTWIVNLENLAHILQYTFLLRVLNQAVFCVKIVLGSSLIAYLHKPEDDTIDIVFNQTVTSQTSRSMPSRMFLQELYSLSTWIINLDNLALIVHHTFFTRGFELNSFLCRKLFSGLHSSPTCTNRQTTRSTLS